MISVISRLHEQSQAVLLISHNLVNVFALAHRVIILRHGQVVGTRMIAETTKEEVVSLITGAQES